MKPYQSRSSIALERVARAPRLAPVAPPRPTIDRIALISLLVAALATIASLVQTAFTWFTRDTPYQTLVYDKQVSRSVAVVDFMSRLKVEVQNWQAMAKEGDLDPRSLREIYARAIRFTEFSETTWLLTESSQRDVSDAAEAFAEYAQHCLMPAADERAPAAACDGQFRSHDATLRQAKDSLLKDIDFDRRHVNGLRLRRRG